MATEIRDGTKSVPEGTAAERSEQTHNQVVGRCSHCNHCATIREPEQKCEFCGEWEWIVAYIGQP